MIHFMDTRRNQPVSEELLERILALPDHGDEPTFGHMFGS